MKEGTVAPRLALPCDPSVCPEFGRAACLSRRGVLRVGEPCVRGFQLARQPRVVVGQPRGVAPEAIDHRDEQLHLLFEPVDRLDINPRHYCFCQRVLLENSGAGAAPPRAAARYRRSAP